MTHIHTHTHTHAHTHTYTHTLTHTYTHTHIHTHTYLAEHDEVHQGWLERVEDFAVVSCLSERVVYLECLGSNFSRPHAAKGDVLVMKVHEWILHGHAVVLWLAVHAVAGAVRLLLLRVHGALAYTHEHVLAADRRGHLWVWGMP
jgi:hypothetical protein